MTGWPYPLEWGRTETVPADVLVIGGGIAGCWAAIGAARAGARVVLVEKGATVRSGAGGTGCDHWEHAATNPCCRLTPEELVEALIAVEQGYNNGISHYIECREGYDRLLDLERMGAKIRDSEGAFRGADFRDEGTGLLLAYDYVNRYTLRVWGTTFKPALHRECRRLGVRILDRTMATGLLTIGPPGRGRVVGATAVHCRTGRFFVLPARAIVLCTSRPTRVWLFSADLPGLCEFRPPQCAGDGHAMAWRAGARFAMMEKSVRAEYSAAGRSYPAYGTGNCHNTWYACTMVDAAGREIPWVDRDGRVLQTVAERYRPAPGQKFFLKGGSIDDPPYEYRGPEIMDTEELLRRGYRLPFYADLGRMPEMERRAIWGLMVGEEAKTRVPIFQAYTEAGFDPLRHQLQSYGGGWRSAEFLPRERQLFGLPGGLLNDWELATTVEGLFAAGDVLFASNCHGHAAATGHYAGRHAARYAARVEQGAPDEAQVAAERERVYAPVRREEGPDWKELNMAVSKVMQVYCGEVKSREMLETGLELLREMEEQEVPLLCARNPHELVRTLETVNVLTTALIIMHACLARRSSSPPLHFLRAEHPEPDAPEERRFITVGLEGDTVAVGLLPLDYYRPIVENYERHNPDYLKGGGRR